MSNELYIPQVDYTSRDYTSIRDDLIALIENFAPQWTSRDSSDFGIVLLELFSYLGDTLNYQIDRAANEAFISTATQRDTILNLAQLFNYVPTDITPAVGSVTFSNSDTVAVALDAGAVVSTISDGINPSVTFTTDAAATIPAISGTTPGTVSVNVTQGKTVNSEVVGTSTGEDNQTFSLSNTGVMTGSTMSVTVGSLTYTKVAYLIDYGPNDPVFSVYTDGAGVTYVQFGDGTSGRVPPNGSTIYVTYRYSETSGALGNVTAGKIINIDSATSGSLPISTGLLTVTNASACSGGANAETTDSIRVNIPKSFRAVNRAVSLEDYESLAVSVGGVAKANAIASSFASVVLYIAATGGATSSAALKQRVRDYLTGKIAPNTTLSILDFTPSYPYLNVNVQVYPQYNATNVAASVTNALYALLNYDNVGFNELITLGEIYGAVRNVEGVSYVTINDFEKLSAIYSQRGTTGTTYGATAATIPMSDTSGLWVGARVIGIGGYGNTNAVVGTASTGQVTYGTTLTAVATNSITLSAAPLSTNSNTLGTPTSTSTSSTTLVLNYSGGHGIPSGATGYTITTTGFTPTLYNLTNASVTVNSTTQLTLAGTGLTGSISATGTAAVTNVIDSSTAITVQGAAGATDLNFLVNEVPILEKSYITVTTTGGTS